MNSSVKPSFTLWGRRVCSGESSQTLAEGSWASHPDVELEWISLNDDGEATVWEALVPLEADQSAAFFRIALEVDESDAP